MRSFIRLTVIVTACLVVLTGCGTMSERVSKDVALKYYIQGLLYENSGNLELASGFYTDSSKLNPENGYVYSKLGRIALKEKRYDDAEKYLKRAIGLNPGDPDNYLNLGVCYFLKKSYANAAENLEKGLKLKESSSYRVILCDLYSATGQDEKAVKSYEILMGEVRDNPLLYYNYGLLLEKMGRDADAKKAYLKALEIAPNFIRAYVNLASIYDSRKEYAKAEECCRKLISIAPQNVSGYSLLSAIYIEEKKWPEAEKILTEAISYGANTSTIYQLAGFVSFQKEDYETAGEYYKKAIALDPSSSAYFYLGVCYDKSGQKPEMEKCMRKAIEMDKTNHLALNYLGYSFLLDDKNLQEAFSLVKKANELDPENGAYLDSLGWAYYKMQQYGDAEKYLLKSEETENDPEVMEHIGYLYYKLNDYTKAIYWWTRSLETKKNPGLQKKIEQAQKLLSP